METKPKRLPFPWLFRWELWRNVLLLLAGLVTVYALFCAEENFRGKRAWKAYKSEMEAKGEIFDYTKFVPPPVPDDQNFAMTPFFAQLFDFIPGTQKTRDSNAWQHVYKVTQALPNGAREALTRFRWQIAKPLDWVELADKFLVTNRHTHEATPLGLEQTQEAVQTIMNKLQPAAGTIEELRKASRRPYSRFNVDYDWEPKFAIILPHLAPVKSACLILELRSCAELRSNDAASAFEDIGLMFHLVQSIRTEPFLVSQLVHASCLGETLQPIWEGLEKRHWSDKQLEDLIKELRALDFMGAGIRCLQGEQSFHDTFFAQLRRSRNPMQDVIDIIGNGNDISDPGAPGDVLVEMMPRGWIYFEQIEYQRMLDNETTGIITPTRVDPDVVNERKIQSVARSSFGIAILRHQAIAQLLLPSLNTVGFQFAKAQTEANLAFVGCALERYRLKHGQYPENLSALTPEYLAAVPNDLIMDQPLKYRLTADGAFVLYSVGSNKKDDGGVPGKKNWDTAEGDWVWKYPSPTPSK